MSLETTAHGDDPEPVTCGVVRRRLEALAADHEALLAALAADPGRQDHARVMHALTVAYREVRVALAGHVFTDAFTTETAAAPPAPGRHAAPARRVADVIPLRPRPRRGAVHGLAPAAVAATLAGHGARHAITAHLKLGLTAAAAAGVTAAGVTYTIQATPDQGPLPAVSAPAAAPAAAPAVVSAPAVPRLVKKHHHRRHARPAALPLLAAPVPAPSGTPAPPVPAAGVLNIQQSAVTLTQTAPGQYTGTLTLYATGGPVRWRIDWLGTTAALQVDQESGIIADGQQATVTVTVDAGLALPGQSWTLTVDPDGQQVTVTAAG